MIAIPANCSARCFAGLLAAALAAGVGDSQAASIRIEGERPAQEITLHIEAASVERALDELAEKFGFEFVGPAGPGSAPLSATFSGNLETLLARLLRNRNHAIVRARSTPGGIRRVVLIDARAGSRLAAPERPGYRRRVKPPDAAAASVQERKSGPPGGLPENRNKK